MQLDSSSSTTINLELIKKEPNFCAISVIVPAIFVQEMYKQAINEQKKCSAAFGFHKRETPSEYIEQNYQINLMAHVKEFLLKYVVLDFLYTEIKKQKILSAGQPRLTSIEVTVDYQISYFFEISLFCPISIQEWKYLPFKAPKRKNYKDLDRQVESFLQEELSAKENSKETIGIGDWVHYRLTLLNSDHDPIMNAEVPSLWLRIGDEEPDKPFQDLFCKKNQGEVFISNDGALQDYFMDPLNINYYFAVEIVDLVPFNYFCLELFKHHFRLKSNKEMYQKLIEVFSYRNDLSQRRAMVEESLKLLLSKHRFDIPNYLVLREQKNVLDIIQYNPDYHVYRVQKDFKDAIRELAEKKVREEIFLDQLAYEEDIDITPADIKSYLNLTKRPRTKEFLHFDPPVTKVRGQEFPVLTSELKRTCLREKTLNHIIYHLTKK